MRNQKITGIRLTPIAILSLLLVLAAPRDALACSCGFQSACQSYTRADAVFVGRVIGVEYDGDFFHDRVVRFSVDSIFKGSVSKIETIIFKPDSCSDRTPQVGEAYFVYRGKGGVVEPCNRTHKLLPTGPNDLGFAKALSKTHPTFAIGVEIPTLTRAELKKTIVSVSDGLRTYHPRSFPDGRFRVTVSKPAKYRVEIHLPFNASNIELVAEPFWFDVNATKSADSTSFDYAVDFVQNGCDERMVRFTKKGKSEGLGM